MDKDNRNFLLLFDIDGTLISGKGIPKQVFYEVVLNRFPYLSPDPGIDLSGQTDPAIVRQVLHSGGYELEINYELIGEILNDFTSLLNERFRGENSPVVLPGVQSLLETLRQTENCYLGLVTGNIKKGARIKLKSSGLMEYFPVGAFGDDSEIRNDLPPLAMRRAAAYYRQSFTPQNTWIIGDSIYDVRCAHANNLHCLAVASGRTAHRQLEAEKPDILVRSLEEIDGFFNRIRHHIS
ncbi:MAG: HAD hydrolase-like protein [Calditrichaceae bacterium]|nr:HAD hydrolase-like protein [Calditrichaceae bacterium]MBN2707847.1 HAD hydrolase-like protein [Calditrichaceae bacterium]RQV94913.1 MAG: HAD family hydrolase [Calditrichota bacterium]